jgi:hypothetical protein
MTKKILVVYYTQSGQLRDIVNCFIVPFQEAGVSVETIQVIPQQDFSFPWTSDRFFDAMPESVSGKSIGLHPIHSKEQKYDLIVVAYQPWFLSPSIPISSLLQEDLFKSLIKNTPVVTLIGARNMWLNAQEKVKKLLLDAGAKLVGNIALVDRNRNLISAVSILYWMMSGKKERYLGVFPKPGVSDKDIAHAGVFGKIVLTHFSNGSWNALQKNLVEGKAVEVNSDLMFIEQRAGKLFAIWSTLISTRKNRKLWLSVFKYYLVIALFVVAPVVLLVNNLLFRPFVGRSVRRKRAYYLGLN